MTQARSATAPPRSADILVCGFGGLSSPQPHAETRESPQPSGWKTCVTVSCVVFWLMVPEVLFALTTNKPPERVPLLRPPAELLEPTWWERRGGQVVIAGVALLAGLGLLTWWLRRPGSILTVPPETAARTALENLRGRTEDAAVVAGVARNLRRYVQAVLGLPTSEWTTDELLRALASRPPADPELAQALGSLLRECETRAFAPVTPPPLPALVDRALAVVARFEALRAPPAPAAPPVIRNESPPAPPVLAPPGARPPESGPANQGSPPSPGS
jgi:hypothetical protein